MTPAGIDAMVAEKVFGWFWVRDQSFRKEGCGKDYREVLVGKPFRYFVSPDSMFKKLPRWNGSEDCDVDPYNYGEKLPAYSTDPAAAWSVVERLRDMGRKVTIEVCRTSRTKIHCDVTVSGTVDDLDSHADVCGESMPAAVCAAALASIGVKP